MKKTFRCSTLG